MTYGFFVTFVSLVNFGNRFFPGSIQIGPRFFYSVLINLFYNNATTELRIINSLLPSFPSLPSVRNFWSLKSKLKNLKSKILYVNPTLYRQRSPLHHHRHL